MPRTEVLVLAMTKMRAGICTAGVTRDADPVTGLRWVRPVREFGTLLPGDIIATGTIEGAAPVLEDDVIIARIQKLGTLEVNLVRSSLVDTWHTPDFPGHYAAFRERDTADKGPDVITPEKESDYDL